MKTRRLSTIYTSFSLVLVRTEIVKKATAQISSLFFTLWKAPQRMEVTELHNISYRATAQRSGMMLI